MSDILARTVSNTDCDVPHPAINGLRQVVVSNAPSCGGVAFAAERGIATLRYPGRKDDLAALTPEDLVARLQDTYRVDIVCLAGYMKAR